MSARRWHLGSFVDVPRRLLITIVLCASLLSACGGSSDTASRAPRHTTAVAPSIEPRGPLDLPANVPLTATGPANRGEATVVRAWSDALRHGDIDAAAALWAVPSKVQNGTPVLKLSSRGDVRIFNDALPCGSVVTATGGAKDDFTIATVRLTKRPGAHCGSGTGSIARTAIRVLDGKIAEWYRLPDDPDAPGLTQPPPDAVDTTVI